MVESLLRNNNVVMETFVCASFSNWEACQAQVVKENIARLRDDIAIKAFWDEVGDVYHVMMPVILALQ